MGNRDTGLVAVKATMTIHCDNSTTGTYSYASNTKAEADNRDKSSLREDRNP